MRKVLAISIIVILVSYILFVAVACNGKIEHITYGSYSQSEVVDQVLIEQLNSAIDLLPTLDNNRQWISYNYYIESELQDFMWYTDVKLGNERYRGVYFTTYRPYKTASNSNMNEQSNNGHEINNVYWFKFEPLSWRVMSRIGKTALVVCDSIIDSQAYQNVVVSVENNLFTTENAAPVNTFAFNYGYSSIRNWLNSDFFVTAFSREEQQDILTTQIDNSSATTPWEDESFVYEDTQDKVFLLSWEEIINKKLGFSSDFDFLDTMRQRKATDYAKVQGLYTFVSRNDDDKIYTDNGNWWLRSPDVYSNGRYVFIVEYDGFAFIEATVNTTRCGVVPAMRVKI